MKEERERERDKKKNIKFISFLIQYTIAIVLPILKSYR